MPNLTPGRDEVRSWTWQTRYTDSGWTYQVWEPVMPRIPDEFLGCVVYLYNTEERAKNGDAAGVGGTGFLVDMFIPGAPKHLYSPRQLYVVTASHVIEKGATVVRLNHLDGTTRVLPTSPDAWVHHPAGDDVAASAIDVDLGWKVSTWPTLSPQQFLAQRRVGSPYEIGPGDDVFIVGRFVNHDGRIRNSPVVRFGAIAMVPGEPICQKTRGSFNQESFLVECRSIPGFSGSPVFIYMQREPNKSPYAQQPTGRPNERGLLSPFMEVQLLGLDWGHIADTRANSQGVLVEHNTGMCAVVPAWKIAELLQGEPFEQARQAKLRTYVEEMERAPDRLD